MHAIISKYAVLFSIFFLPEYAAKSAELSVPLQVSTGCHGNTHGDFLTPACANQTIIAVSGVYAMVKKTDTGCPEAATETDRDEEKCCTYSTRDCKLLYLASEMSFYEDCTGVYTCNMKVATQLTQGCNDVGYLLRSNYMMMEYFCVPRSRTLDGDDDASVSDTSVYLKSKGYPAGLPGGAEVSCSIAASCDTPVIITAIHVDLQGNNSGTCLQHLNIKDNNEEMRIDCDNNNGDTFKITEAFKSKSHFLLISFLNDNSGNTGRYWRELKAEAGGATVEMTCGNDAASTPTTVDKCADNTGHSKAPASVTDNPAISESISDKYKMATFVLATALSVSVVVVVVMCAKYCKAQCAIKKTTKVSPDGFGDLQGKKIQFQEQCGVGNGSAPTGFTLPNINVRNTHAQSNSPRFNDKMEKVIDQ